jgi:hypothetical protein
MLQGVPDLRSILIDFLCSAPAFIHSFTSVSFPTWIGGKGI